MAKDLTIDEVLNILDSPNQSLYYSYGPKTAGASRPSYSNMSSGHHTPFLNQMPSPVNSYHQANSNLMRNSAFKSPPHAANNVNSRSFSQSSSFDEQSSHPTAPFSASSISGAEMEHRLKLLETCFNQIAMAHHSDQQLVQSCIEIYKEKYQKADKYMNLLFDEMNGSLNRIVNCFNDNTTMPMQKRSAKDYASGRRRSSRYSISEQMSINDDYSYLNDAVSSQEVFPGSGSPFDEALAKSVNSNDLICLTKRDKKCIQENLNVINRTMSQMRKNIISLITSSSMISGVKQVRTSFAGHILTK